VVEERVRVSVDNQRVAVAVDEQARRPVGSAVDEAKGVGIFDVPSLRIEPRPGRSVSDTTRPEG
jgi:hypothetical protein